MQDRGLKVEWLIETHAHADHLSAAPYIQEKRGGKLGIGENIRIVQEVFGKISMRARSSGAMAASSTSCSRMVTPTASVA